MAEVGSHGHAREDMDHEGFLKLANYPLIKQSDMNEEMRLEAVEICASGEAALDVLINPEMCNQQWELE